MNEIYLYTLIKVLRIETYTGIGVSVLCGSTAYHFTEGFGVMGTAGETGLECDVCNA